MTTLPQITVLDDIIAYPDDENPNMFYLARSTPQIRMDGDMPIFNGLFWTDKADGADNSTAGLAGGYINFDINLGISEEEKRKAAAKLKSMKIQQQRRREIVKLEKERLGLIARARGEDRVPEPDVPRVGEITFGALEYTDGTVTLLEEKEGGLVSWSSAGGPASLIGDNNAAFAIRLSPDGAAVWYKALQQGDKAISTRYDLKFRLRLPSLEIRAWAGSTQTSQIDRKVDRVWKNQDQGCSDADVERIDVSSVVETMTEEGLLNIEIKKGSTEISDEHVSELRDMAIKLIEEKVKEIIKSRIHGMTQEERKTSMIELMKEEVKSFVELRFTQRDVVEWKMAPQATIMNFLEGVSEANKKNITKVVDLADDIVGTVEIPLQVNAPWEEAPFVSSVKVISEYPSAEESKSWLFDKNTTKNKWLFRRPKKDDAVVKYTSEVYFKGVSEPLVIPVKETNGLINIEVGKVGLMVANFKPHSTLNSLSGDNKVINIQVDINYKNESDSDHFKTTLLFTPEEVDGKKLERAIYKHIDAPIEYTVTYFSKNGKVIEMPSQKYYFTQNQPGDIFTPNPYEDTLEVDVELGMSPDQSLKKIIVEFQYKDENNQFTSEDKVELAAEDDWEPVTAKLVQLDRDMQEFRYRYKLVGDNLFSKSGWVDSSGDQTLILPILQVGIDVSRLKIGEKYQNVVLEMAYKNGTQDIRHQFFLNSESAQKPLNWFIPRIDEGHDSYNYSLTLYPEQGDQIEVENLEGKGKFLIIKDVNP
ncbi:hypothetical protein [uncultured Psychroserpens sp.]|uniref:hypothetical protein n=1 Tax=uncultured Psychroserpens sp. TaxID=255436 RepID=UPI002621965B|nr:hypothetical protein [uncultured Psychroserpens sp.]